MKDDEIQRLFKEQQNNDWEARIAFVVGIIIVVGFLFFGGL